jgi:hypothetical protein
MAFMKQLLLIYLLGMAVLFSADANAVQDTSSASADPNWVFVVSKSKTM